MGKSSPACLPEATNVDEDTLQKLSTAAPLDYYLSHASPLGIHSIISGKVRQKRKEGSESKREDREVPAIKNSWHSIQNLLKSLFVQLHANIKILS